MGWYPGKILGSIVGQILDVRLLEYNAMPIYRWETYASRIPEQSVGNYSIKKKVIKSGETLPMEGVLGYDCALFLRDCVITVLEQYQVKINDEVLQKVVWMSDSPMEYYAMWELNARVKPSRVLVGGLGLGILANILSNRRDISNITVVEISPEIIQMVKPYVPSWIKIVQGDFIKYIYDAEARREQYDTIVSDIYSGNIEIDENLLEEVQIATENYIATFPETTVLHWNYQREKESEKIISYMIHEARRKGKKAKHSHRL